MARTHSKEQLEVRNAKRSDDKGVSFIALASSPLAAQEFGQYITHLAPAGARKAAVTVDKNKIYFTSVVSHKNTGRVCHHIQLKAKALGVVYPYWITKAAYVYRRNNEMPLLRRRSKNPRQVTAKPVQVAEPKVTKVVKRTVAPSKRTYYRVPAWKRFFRWLGK